MVLFGTGRLYILGYVFGEGGVFSYDAARFMGALIVVASGTSVTMFTYGRTCGLVLRLIDVLVLVSRSMLRLVSMVIGCVKYYFGGLCNVTGRVIGVRYINHFGLYLVSFMGLYGLYFSTIGFDLLARFFKDGRFVLDL